MPFDGQAGEWHHPAFGSLCGGPAGRAGPGHAPVFGRRPPPFESPEGVGAAGVPSRPASDYRTSRAGAYRGESMRFSKRKAEAEAVRIATVFVAANGGAEWSCRGAKPDDSSPGFKRRKNVIKWSVMFDRSIGESVVDGPTIVQVDTETGGAAFLSV